MEREPVSKRQRLSANRSIRDSSDLNQFARSQSSNAEPAQFSELGLLSTQQTSQRTSTFIVGGGDSFPGTVHHQLRSLSNPTWGLDSQFIEGLRGCGIEQMYDWQVECLSLRGILSGDRTLVYTAPNSAGKSLGEL